MVFYQTEYELGPEGKELFRDKQKLEYAIGSGQNEITFYNETRQLSLRGVADVLLAEGNVGTFAWIAGVDFGFNTPWLADNIRMNCHQGRTLRILKPGRDYQDFRPGTRSTTPLPSLRLGLSQIK